jgi:hypothetical protein
MTLCAPWDPGVSLGLKDGIDSRPGEFLELGFAL